MAKANPMHCRNSYTYTINMLKTRFMVNGKVKAPHLAALILAITLYILIISCMVCDLSCSFDRSIRYGLQENRRSWGSAVGCVSV